MLKNKLRNLRVLIAVITLLSILMASTAAGLLTVNASGPNLLKNGDFETGKTDGWTNWTNASVVSETSYEGKFCLKLSSQNWGAFFQEFNAVPNTAYRLVFWFRNINSAKCGVYIKDVTHGDNEISQVWFTGASGSKWEKLVVPFVCPEGATKLKVNFTGEQLTEKYIDNIVVEKAPEMSNDGYIKNGNFETGTADEWNNGGDSAIIGEEAYEGQFSLKLAGGDWKEFSQEFDAEPGIEYTLTYYLKAEAENQVSAGYIKCGDAEVAKFDIVGSTDKWTRQTVRFTPGPSQTRLKLLFYPQKFVKYIDNISITAPKLMLKNGNFESGNYEGWINYAAAEIVSDEVHTGKYALRLSSKDNKEFSQNFAVSAGTDYRLVFWIKNINASPIKIILKDITGEKNDIVAEKQVKAGGSGWEKILLPFKSPAAAAKMQLCFCGTELSEKYLDDIKIVYLPPVSNDGFIKNGTFETGETDEWVVENGSEVTEYEAYDGNCSLKLVGADGSAVHQSFDVEPSIEHTLTFYGKAADDGGKGTGYIKDADTDTVLAKFDMSFGKTDWSRQTVTFIPTAATVRAKLMLCPDGNTLYIDNVSVSALQSLLPNGGFERGTEGWSLNNSSAVEGGAAAYTGNKGLHLVKSGAGDDLSSVTRSINVNSKAKYRLIFYYKNESSGESRVYIKYKEAFGGNEKVLLSESIDGSTTEWSKKIIDFTVPNGIKLVTLVLCPVKSGKYLDEFTLKSVNSASYDGYIKNGDFETGTTEGWMNETDSEITFMQVCEGDAALKLTGDGEGAFWQSFDVEPNTEYTLNVWGRAAVRNKNAAMIIKEERADGDRELISVTTTFGAGEWTQQTIRFSSDATMTRAKLMFLPMGNTVYLDNIGITAVESLIKNGGFETGNFKNWTIGSGSDSKVKDYAAHLGNYGMHLAGYKWAVHRQDFKVKPGTTYEISCWFKDVAHMGPSYVVIRAGNTIDNILLIPLQANDDEWHYISGLFNSGDWDTMRVQLITESGDKYIDDISIVELGVAQDLHSVTNLAPRLLRVNSAENNLISGADFETDGNWNNAGFTGGPLKVIDDPENAHNGSKVLRFKGVNLDKKEKRILRVEVEPNTQYMFSAWVKGTNISSANCGDATFGVMDYVSKKFLIGNPVASDPGSSMDSTPDRQLVPPAYDNSWHLRGIEFNSGERTEIGIAVYGSDSEIYLDELVLCRVENCVRYNSKYNTGIVSLSPNEGDSGCDPENNLIENFNFSDSGSDFWETGYIYGNFVSVADARLGYGKSLKYSEGENPVGNTYIKWVDVEPERDYIFTFDIQVTKDGDGSISLLDDKNTIPTTVFELNFDAEDFGNGWHTVSVNFNPGIYEKIGICITDFGGEAYFDNVRIFEASKANSVKEPFNPDEIAAENRDGTDDEDNKGDSGIPRAGDAVFKTVTVMLAVSALAFVMTAGLRYIGKKQRNRKI